MSMNIHDLNPSYGRPSPASSPEGLKRVTALIKTVRGNADLLHEALVNAEGPRDLRGELVQEFLSRCQQARELVQSQMQWVVAEANNPRHPVPGLGPTTATRLLKELQRANDILSSVLRLYDDLVRVGFDTEAQERVKNDHTIRILTANASTGDALSVDDRRQQPLPPPPPPRGIPSSSHDDKVRKLFSIAQIGRGNAELLRDTLASARPADINGALIQEFAKNCRDSQKEIFENIQWADVEAAASRRSARTDATMWEEQLFQELLAADDVLTGVLKMYDDFQRDGVSTMHAIQQSQESSRASAETGGDLQQLFEACRTARGNADVLRFALVNAKPSDLQGEVIQEFLTSCRESQDQIVTKIPWATSEAERSRGPERVYPSTLHEELLQELLAANEELNKVMNMYADIEHGRLAESSQESLQVNQTPGWANADLLKRPASAGQLVGNYFRTPAEDLGGLPPLTPEDRAKFMKIFLHAGPKSGVLSGEQVKNLLLKSKLPPETLSRIWDLADTKVRGALDVSDFTIAMYLVQACMSGQIKSVPDSLPAVLFDQASGKPLPSFPRQISDGPIPGPSRLHTRSISQQINGSTPERPASYSNLSMSRVPQQHADRIFETLDPEGTGHAQGYVVASFMLKSGLSIDVLNQIWDLADTGAKGYLTRDEFAKAMALVDMRKAGKDLPEIPSAAFAPKNAQTDPTAGEARLPEPSLIDLDEPLAGPSTPRTPSRQVASSTGSPMSLPTTPLTLDTQTLRPQPTGSAFDVSPFSASPPRGAPSHTLSPLVQQQASDAQHWDVDPVAKARFDKFFDTLDPRRKGYIEGDVAVPFFAKSKLPDSVLAAIWDLADTDHDGRLTRDEFAVAMHLICEKLSGKRLPDVLPPSLVPPSVQPPPLPSREPSQNASVPSASPPSFAEAVVRVETPPPPYEAIAGR